MKRHAFNKGRFAIFGNRVSPAIFWLSVSLLVLVPSIFTTRVYRIYSLPKFAVLLFGSAALLVLFTLCLSQSKARLKSYLSLLKSKHVALVCLYLITIGISTALGVAPVASLFGSFENQMGLISYLCFFFCFVGLIVGTGINEKRFFILLWSMALTGLLVAAYAVAQALGLDPIVPPSLYTFNSADGPIVRVASTLGHANYLGNFLLYTTPMSAGLALTASGRARYVAILATMLSIISIACSGTRGAWLGLIVGLLVFAWLETRNFFLGLIQLRKPRVTIVLTCFLAFVMFLAWVISLSPASGAIAARTRSLVSEGMTGSGRTILWRDSIRMLPSVALVGCGPEGFRKAFLAYKSKELARLAPQINNESSHNSYLDAAISFGLPGAALYFAIVLSGLILMLRARKLARTQKHRIIGTGLISSLIAVQVHNIFIFNQIPTGLYFFAFVALARVMSNVVKAQSKEDNGEPNDKGRRPGRRAGMANGSAGSHNSHRLPGSLCGLMFAISAAIFVAAAWYSASILQADVATRSALMRARSGSLQDVLNYRTAVVSAPDPTGAYRFLFAHTLASLAQRMQNNNLQTDRARVLNLAMEDAGKSAPYTLTPDSTYMLLAYIALLAGDSAKLKEYASMAIRWDPNYSNAHWLMAEAFLSTGDRDKALNEAELALDLNPSSKEAVSALNRARGGGGGTDSKVEVLIERGLRLARDGDISKAERVITKAINRANGDCAQCHRALALVYETAHLYEAAITEWETFMRESPDRASAEQLAAHVENLRRRNPGTSVGR